ncbi:MAG TPA: hypothetical protein VF115_03990 [Acidimicrobiia bacterium]
MSRTAVALAAAAGVVALVVTIIVVSLVPLPEFEPLAPNNMSGSLAFVDEDNCVHIANLGAATVTELRCEPEQAWIEEITWTEQGIEITAYLNQPTTRVLDPLTGEILGTRVGDEVISDPPLAPVGLVVDSPDEGEIVIFDEDDRKLLILQGPERYWIESAIPNTDLGLVAITDSLGRLAVFDRNEPEPLLVSDDARSWPYPVWEP